MVFRAILVLGLMTAPARAQPGTDGPGVPIGLRPPAGRSGSTGTFGAGSNPDLPADDLVLAETVRRAQRGEEGAFESLASGMGPARLSIPRCAACSRGRCKGCAAGNTHRSLAEPSIIEATGELPVL